MSEGGFPGKIKVVFPERETFVMVNVKRTTTMNTVLMSACWALDPNIVHRDYSLREGDQVDDYLVPTRLGVGNLYCSLERANWTVWARLNSMQTAAAGPPDMSEIIRAMPHMFKSPRKIIAPEQRWA